MEAIVPFQESVEADKQCLISGFFVEAGAFDGTTDSTSLHFEIAHQWSGLLVEPVSRYSFSAFL